MTIANDAVPVGRRVARLAGLPLAGCAVVLLFAALLVSLRLEKAVGDLVDDRVALLASQLTEVVEGGLRFGVPVADQSETVRKMRALMDSDAELQTLALLDDTGKVLLVQDRDGMVPALSPRRVQRLLLQPPGRAVERYTRSWREHSSVHTLMQARDATGTTGAVIWAVYAAQASQAVFERTLPPLLWTSVALLAGLALVVTAGVGWVVQAMRQRLGAQATAPFSEPGASS
jgi:hypothetical protein